MKSLEGRHNQRDGVSNHRRFDCMLKRLFRQKWKKYQSSALLGPLWWESTSDRWIFLTKGQYRGKSFHLMTSSCQMGPSLNELQWIALVKDTQIVDQMMAARAMDSLPPIWWSMRDNKGHESMHIYIIISSSGSKVGITYFTSSTVYKKLPRILKKLWKSSILPREIFFIDTIQRKSR